MGAFYGNIVLSSVTQQQAIEALRGRRAAASPEIGGYVVVFDSVCDDQNTDALQQLSQELSEKLNSISFGLIVHDDDVLFYVCYKHGELIDWYNSAPSYFDFGSTKVPLPPAGGISDKLLLAFPSANRIVLQSVLHEAHYVLETERHVDLVNELGLPGVSVGVALASLERGEVIDGLPIDQIVWAADPPPQEDPELRWDREFYERLGSENPLRPCKRKGCSRGSIKLGLLCKPHHFEMIKGRPCPFEV